ncbi:MAG: type II toxin-antitoxin system RelE/ParE family toxin [Campylobacterota bacterium]|nr:type II toxin-antitoxin system RelE/ParE family toxin [Campylobacterota bacterium]
MTLDIQYQKSANKFFLKNSSILTKVESNQLITKAVKKLIKKEDINIDIKLLKGNLKKYYRIRSGKIRILFELIDNEIKIIAIVNDVDFRGNIY